MKATTIPLAAIVLVLAGCGKGEFSSPKTEAGVLRQALPSDITCIDPAKVQDTDYIEVVNNVYDGLVGYDENNRIVGRLAEKFESPDHGKTWVFHLRKGVKFHNGREVVADDVKWSIERALSPEIASPVAGIYLDDIAPHGVKVVDPSTVSITLTQPRAYFLGKLTCPCAFVLAKEAVGKGAIETIAQSVGTGPFKLTELKPAERVVMVANPDYYLGKPKIERLERPIITDSSTRLNKFRAGELDFLSIDASEVPGVLADPKLKPLLGYRPRPAVDYMGINQTNLKELQDERVRRAIIMAIDRDKICSTLLNGIPRATTLIAKGVPGYRADYKGLPYDPAAAKKLLAEAGYPNGAGFPELPFAYMEKKPDSVKVVESIESQLRSNLGIHVKPQAMPLGTMLSMRNDSKLTLYFLGWYADYIDPQDFLSLLLAGYSKENHDGYRNAEFDRLCLIGDTSIDEATRMDAYHKAEDIAINTGVRAPIDFVTDPTLTSARAKGIRTNLMGTMPMTVAEVVGG